MGVKLHKLTKKVTDGLKKIGDFVEKLYDKYIKPLVALIGECLKEAKSPAHFFMCLARPIIEKLMSILLPAGSVPRQTWCTDRK